MIWLIYNLLFPIGFVLMLPHFLLRMFRRGGYAGHFGQRFGSYGAGVKKALKGPPRLWIHAVSVGEMYVALDFIKACRAREPGVRFVISTVTSTGRGLALDKADKRDVVIYYPLDFPWIVSRALSVIRPRMVILTEGELWPNMLRYCRKRKVPVAIINARMSLRSAMGYKKLLPFARRTFTLVGRILAQSVLDRSRYLDLGADPDRVEVLGSVKYDMAPVPGAAAQAAAVLKQAGWPETALIFLGGSTWPGEERAMAEAFKRLYAVHPDLRLVLVPRHAERAQEAEDDLKGLDLRIQRRSTLAGGVPVSPDVLLVDTTGELKSFYAAAHVVFVGKSLFENRGGQNFVEPAVYGKPILVGPHLENFPSIEADFAEVTAFARVTDADSLFNQADRLLRDPAAREDMGRRAAELVARKRGVMETTVNRILEMAGGMA